MYVSDTNPLPKKVKKHLKGKSQIWYNTLWDTMAGGHDDDQSLVDPDKGYGYLIDTFGATILQTDRPGYLRQKNEDVLRRFARDILQMLLRFDK